MSDEKQELADFDYRDEKEWWDARWTHGTRYALEHMAPEVLTQFKAEVFEKLSQERQLNVRREPLLVRYILAEK